jgi:hypothetical protein
MWAIIARLRDYSPSAARKRTNSRHGAKASTNSRRCYLRNKKLLQYFTGWRFEKSKTLG